MNIEVKRTFIKDFSKLPQSVQLQVTDFLRDFENISSIRELSHTKKLI